MVPKFFFVEGQCAALLTQCVGTPVVTTLKYSTCSAQYRCEQQPVLNGAGYVSSVKSCFPSNCKQLSSSRTFCSALVRGISLLTRLVTDPV